MNDDIKGKKEKLKSYNFCLSLPVGGGGGCKFARGGLTGSQFLEGDC